MSSIVEYDAVLEAKLEPLSPYLRRQNVEEICANRAGEIGLDIVGKGTTWIADSRFSLRYWDELCHILANKSGLLFDTGTQPIVSTRLPGGHRFEAMLGKTVSESGLSISIRLKRSYRGGLELFAIGENSGRSAPRGCGASKILGPAPSLTSPEFSAWLLQAVAAGCNILISGGTSSGKTTLLNALGRAIPKDTRVLCVEDTREIELPHVRNKNFYVVSRNEANPHVGYGEVFDHMMRSHPNIIIAGELSLRNAYPALLLMNSGHRGFMCTMHANSARLALEEGFYQRITLSGHAVQKRDLVEYLGNAIDLVIQCGMGPDGKRSILEIWEPGRSASTGNAKGP